MKPPCTLAAVAATLLVLSSGAHAVDDRLILQMTTCQESWLEFKDNPVKVKTYFGAFESETQFRREGSDGSFVPVAPSTLFGQNIRRVYPQSVGMGLGYSVIVDARFDTVKASMEKQVGKPFDQCSVEDGAKSCGLDLAEKKTIMLMEGSRGKNPQTLVGCYYYYEK